jgi:transcription antitermination factor NusG
MAMAPHPFAAGDRVRVIDGPLAGFEADVQAVRAASLALVVDVNALHVPIETTFAQVEMAPRPAT